MPVYLALPNKQLRLKSLMEVNLMRQKEDRPLKKLTIMMGLTMCLVCAGCGDDDTGTGPGDQPVTLLFSIPE